jgi:hypothetical protein
MIFRREVVTGNSWRRLKGERFFQNILIFTVWTQGRTLGSVLIFETSMTEWSHPWIRIAFKTGNFWERLKGERF